MRVEHLLLWAWNLFLLLVPSPCEAFTGRRSKQMRAAALHSLSLNRGSSSFRPLPPHVPKNLLDLNLDEQKVGVGDLLERTPAQKNEMLSHTTSSHHDWVNREGKRGALSSVDQPRNHSLTLRRQTILTSRSYVCRQQGLPPPLQELVPIKDSSSHRPSDRLHDVLDDCCCLARVGFGWAGAPYLLL